MLLANAMRLLQWAVGDIFITTNDINPATRFGGTWERFAKGKTLVGFDDGDNDFNEINKTGGNKIHEVPYAPVYGLYGTSYFPNRVLINKTSESGSNHKVSTLQPYITVYFWRKTA